MVNEELLNAISEMMDKRFDAFGKQIDEKLDKRFDKFGKQIDEKLDKRFDEFGKQVDEKLDKRFDEFGKQVDQKLDQRFDEFGEQVDQRFDAVNERMDYLEFKIGHTMKKLDDLKLDMQIMNRDLKRDYHQLNDTLETVVEVLRTHELIPR